MMLTITSCKKETSLITPNQLEVVNLPTLVKNAAAPNGVLSFPNKKSLEFFLKQLDYDKAPDAGKLPTGFKSLHQRFENYENKKASIRNSLSTHSQNDKQTFSEDEAIVEVSEEEYLYDLERFLVPDDRLTYVLNDDLQIMVEGDFYQVTRLGLLVVQGENINDFAAWYPAQENTVLYHPEVTSFPNEVALGNETYEVGEGIVRYPYDEQQSTASDNFYMEFAPSGSITPTPPEVMDTYVVALILKKTKVKG